MIVPQHCCAVMVHLGSSERQRNLPGHLGCGFSDINLVGTRLRMVIQVALEAVQWQCRLWESR